MDLATFEKKTLDGTLTMGDAFDYAMNREDVIDNDSRTSRLRSLRNAVNSDKIPSASLDSPFFATVKSQEFQKDLSPKGTTTANFFGPMQGLEKELNAGFATFDYDYQSIAGAGGTAKKAGLGGGQSRGARPMEGSIPSKQLDNAYADAFGNMGSNVDPDTKAFLFFHKNTVARVETLLGTKNKGAYTTPPLTLDGIIVSENPDTGNLTVEIKGVKSGNKARNAITYEGAMAEFLSNQVDKAKAASPGKALKDTKLFDTTPDRVRKAHKTYIAPIVEERFPTAIPKNKDGVAAWQLTDIRSAVQDQLAREFKVDPALREDYVGHKQPGVSGTSYLSASADGRELGQLSETLLAQNAKNVGVPNVNLLVNSTFDLNVSSLSSEGNNLFPALDEDFRGQPTTSAPRLKTEAEMLEIDQAARTRTAQLKEQEVQSLGRIADAPPIDEAKLRSNLDVADQVAKLKGEYRAEKKTQKAADAASKFDDVLDYFTSKFVNPKDLKSIGIGMLAAAKTGLSSLPGPVGGLATAVLDPEGMDVAEQKGREFVSDATGADKQSVLGTLGGAAGIVGEMATGAVADPEGAADFSRKAGSFITRPSSFMLNQMQQSMQPSETPGPQAQIQAPPPTNQGVLSAENAKEKVNLATRAAEQGQETPMTGSFLTQSM